MYGIDGNKNLKAYDGADAIGIVFGNIANTGPVTTTATSIGYQYAQRVVNDSNWVQRISCWSLAASSCSRTNGTITQWAYYNTPTGTVISDNTKPADATCNRGAAGCSANSGTSPMNGSLANRTWSSNNLNGADWQAGLNVGAAGLVGVGVQSGMPSTNMAPNPTMPAASFTNLGSAVIDGMLIQHMKITTKGL